MKNYTIKRLSLFYTKEIVAIVHKSLKEDFSEYEDRVSYIHRTRIFNNSFFRKLIKEKNNVIFGAFLNKKLVGIITAKYEMGGVIFIDWLVVKKEYRNIGIGKALLNKIELWALKLKYHYMYLLTLNNWDIEFYKRRGFRYVGVHENGYFGATEHIMSKQLKDKPFEEMFEKYLKKK